MVCASVNPEVLDARRPRETGPRRAGKVERDCTVPEPEVFVSGLGPDRHTACAVAIQAAGTRTTDHSPRGGKPTGSVQLPGQGPMRSYPGFAVARSGAADAGATGAAVARRNLLIDRLQERVTACPRSSLIGRSPERPVTLQQVGRKRCATTIRCGFLQVAGASRRTQDPPERTRAKEPYGPSGPPGATERAPADAVGVPRDPAGVGVAAPRPRFGNRRGTVGRDWDGGGVGALKQHGAAAVVARPAGRMSRAELGGAARQTGRG